MTRSEILQLFAGMRPARQGDGYAPHKPLVVLLLLEKVLNGQANVFPYDELDSDLRRLLDKYGFESASAARNEPFWRLSNDGILSLTAPFSLLQLGSTPTPTELIREHVTASFDPEVYAALHTEPDLVRTIAEAIADRFLNATQRRAIIADAAPSIARLQRNFWWVSQNKTYREEIDGNFMWSPRTNADGTRSPYYDFMTQMAVGDVVFSFAGSMIRALGEVVSPATPCPKPANFGGAAISWLDDGWLVGVAFHELGASAIRPGEHMALLAPTLPDRYSPMRKDGSGNQMYLALVPHSMADVLTALIGPPAQAIVDDVSLISYTRLFSDLGATAEGDATAALAQRKDIGPTQRTQLILARRGQGLFKANVRQIERSCRITQTDDPLHLIASHIKPWSKSNDDEKISGYNGLLLSPHVDHLFDRGYLSFEDTGKIIISKKLDPAVLDQWHIDAGVRVESFRNEQRPFLDYHRDVVLMR